MAPDNNLEEQEERALEQATIKDEETGEAELVDITDLSDEELVEQEEEWTEEQETLSENFIKEVQLNAAKESRIRIRKNPTNLPQTGESLDAFIARKEEAFREGTQEEEESETSPESSSETKKTFTIKIGGKRVT